MRQRPRDDAATWRFAIADGALALILVAIPHVISSDGGVRFDALSRLLGGEGASPMFFSYIGPLFSVPLFLLGRVIYTPAWWCARYNAILLILGVFVLGKRISRMAGARLAGTFALVVCAASMFPNPTRDYFGEMFTAITVAVGLLAIAEERLLAGSVLVAVGVANTPSTAAGLVLATAALVWDTRRLRNLTPIVIAAALIVGESWLRHGTLVDHRYINTTGYKTVLPYSGLIGFSYPLWFGLLSVLFSFGKGLVFFAPGLLIPLPKNVPDELRAWWRYSLWFVAGLVMMYAKWWAWFGGWTWGPRFFLIASIPASLALAANREWFRTLGTARLAALTGALMLSTWVAIDGAVFNLTNMDVCLANNDALHFLCWYVPEFSALWRPFVAPATESPTEALFAWYCVGVGVWLIAPLAAEIARRAGAFAGAETPWRLRELRW